ncbi:MAG: hypothetical protein WDW36_002556 [Sanguina aurantia]
MSIGPITTGCSPHRPVRSAPTRQRAQKSSSSNLDGTPPTPPWQKGSTELAEKGDSLLPPHLAAAKRSKQPNPPSDSQQKQPPSEPQLPPHLLCRHKPASTAAPSSQAEAAKSPKPPQVKAPPPLPRHLLDTDTAPQPIPASTGGQPSAASSQHSSGPPGSGGMDRHPATRAPATHWAVDRGDGPGLHPAVPSFHPPGANGGPPQMPPFQAPGSSGSSSNSHGRASQQPPDLMQMPSILSFPAGTPSRSAQQQQQQQQQQEHVQMPDLRPTLSLPLDTSGLTGQHVSHTLPASLPVPEQSCMAACLDSGAQGMFPAALQPPTAAAQQQQQQPAAVSLMPPHLVGQRKQGLQAQARQAAPSSTTHLPAPLAPATVVYLPGEGDASSKRSHDPVPESGTSHHIPQSSLLPLPTLNPLGSLFGRYYLGHQQQGLSFSSAALTCYVGRRVLLHTPPAVPTTSDAEAGHCLRVRLLLLRLLEDAQRKADIAATDNTTSDLSQPSSSTDGFAVPVDSIRASFHIVFGYALDAERPCGFSKVSEMCVALAGDVLQKRMQRSLSKPGSVEMMLLPLEGLSEVLNSKLEEVRGLLRPLEEERIRNARSSSHRSSSSSSTAPAGQDVQVQNQRVMSEHQDQQQGQQQGVQQPLSGQQQLQQQQQQGQGQYQQAPVELQQMGLQQALTVQLRQNQQLLQQQQNEQLAANLKQLQQGGQPTFDNAAATYPGAASVGGNGTGVVKTEAAGHSVLASVSGQPSGAWSATPQQPNLDALLLQQIAAMIPADQFAGLPDLMLEISRATAAVPSQASLGAASAAVTVKVEAAESKAAAAGSQLGKPVNANKQAQPCDSYPLYEGSPLDFISKVRNLLAIHMTSIYLGTQQSVSIAELERDFARSTGRRMDMAVCGYKDLSTFLSKAFPDMCQVTSVPDHSGPPGQMVIVPSERFLLSKNSPDSGRQVGLHGRYAGGGGSGGGGGRRSSIAPGSKAASSASPANPAEQGQSAYSKAMLASAQYSTLGASNSAQAVSIADGAGQPLPTASAQPAAAAAAATGVWGAAPAQGEGLSFPLQAVTHAVPQTQQRYGVAQAGVSGAQWATPPTATNAPPPPASMLEHQQLLRKGTSAQPAGVHDRQAPAVVPQPAAAQHTSLAFRPAPAQPYASQQPAAAPVGQQYTGPSSAYPGAACAQPYAAGLRAQQAQQQYAQTLYAPAATPAAAVGAVGQQQAPTYTTYTDAYAVPATQRSTPAYPTQAQPQQVPHYSQPYPAPVPSYTCTTPAAAQSASAHHAAGAYASSSYPVAQPTVALTPTVQQIQEQQQQQQQQAYSAAGVAHATGGFGHQTASAPAPSAASYGLPAVASACAQQPRAQYPQALASSTYSAPYTAAQPPLPDEQQHQQHQQEQYAAHYAQQLHLQQAYAPVQQQTAYALPNTATPQQSTFTTDPVQQQLQQQQQQQQAAYAYAYSSVPQQAATPAPAAAATATYPPAQTPAAAQASYAPAAAQASYAPAAASWQPQQYQQYQYAPTEQPPTPVDQPQAQPQPATAPGPQYYAITP